jgi:glutamyl-tRNA reductase
MGGLTASALNKAGAREITIINRDVTKAVHLAQSYGAKAAGLADLPRLLEIADIVVSATASTSHVITKNMINSPITIVDLAVPRDVEPGVAELPGVTLIDVERMAAELGPQTAEVAAVEAIVAAEVEAFTGWLRGAEVAPTVAALRARADEFVAAELERLGRRADLSDEQRAEVAHSMHRIVQRLLHEPTVRVRQLAAGPDGEAYPRLMRELFGLDLSTDRVGQIPQIVGEA